MRPVLKNADKVLVNRIVYNASSPKRGDIIVFKPKGNESSHYYTKRIVGLPGETVQIVENRIYINGKKLEEDYTTTKIDTAGIAAEKVKLGGDEYFVMGDNRKEQRRQPECRYRSGKTVLHLRKGLVCGITEEEFWIREIIDKRRTKICIFNGIQGT